MARRDGESAESFIPYFKRMRNICKIHLLKNRVREVTQRELGIELRKKFQGIKFKDFYELVANKRV